MKSSFDSNTVQITPTRRLAAKERKVFDRVVSEFLHLQPSDAEQLTQYAEAIVRYETAVKESKKHPTISVPVINRSTGNIVGEKLIRNPALTTLKEAQSQHSSLARRLMIDAHSAEKRQRMLTKKARALQASEQKSANDASALNDVTEEQIQVEIQTLREIFTEATPSSLRQRAIWQLTDPYLNMPPCTEEQIASGDTYRCEEPGEFDVPIR